MTVQTKKKSTQVKSRIAQYCAALNVKVPEVITQAAEHEAWRTENRNRMAHGANRAAIADQFGATYRKQRVIFINVEKLNDEKKLDKVIRREMIHLAKPSYYRTRPAFQDRMERLKTGDVRNGRFCKPGKKQLVEAK